MQIRRHLVTALLAVLAAGAPGNVDAAAGEYELLVDGDRVSLEAQETPLARVLQDLGGKAGFEVDAEISDDVTVTLSFKDRQTEEAIAALCKPVGYLLVRDPTGTRVTKVVLTPKSVRANRTTVRQAEPPGWRPKEPLPPEPTEEPSPARATEQEADKRDD
jgi:hypothetical protein